MSLITLSQYKSFNPQYDGTQDALVTSLIDAASASVEKYCDRKFTQADQYEWLDNNVYFANGNTVYYTEQYPINYVLFYGKKSNALTISNGNTIGYNISIKDDALRVTTSDLSSTSFSLVTYATLTTLVAAIVSAYPTLTISINTKSSQSSRTLRVANYAIAASSTIEIVGAEQIVNSDNTLSDMAIRLCGGLALIVYNYGYTTIPTDLQLIVAQVTNDTYKQQILPTDRTKQSESWLNYSYSNANNSNIDLYNIVSNYKLQLSDYKRIVI